MEMHRSASFGQGNVSFKPDAQPFVPGGAGSRSLVDAKPFVPSSSSATALGLSGSLGSNAAPFVPGAKLAYLSPTKPWRHICAD